MKSEVNGFLIGASDAASRGIGGIISNLGKVVAAITLLVACLVTFTDVALMQIDTESYATTLAVMIISSYLMYFSLFDVGEERGTESEAFLNAHKHYTATRVKINGDMMPNLRSFCEEYSKEDLNARRKERLMLFGYSEDEISQHGKDRRKRRARRSIERMRAYILTPRQLLSSDKRTERSELANPERTRIIRSFLKLIPSTVCMCLTVSVVLSPKDGLSTADIINGIIKLSALPIVGIRGYVCGLIYSERTRASWLRTRTRILEAFLASQ